MLTEPSGAELGFEAIGADGFVGWELELARGFHGFLLWLAGVGWMGRPAVRPSEEAWGRRGSRRRPKGAQLKEEKEQHQGEE